MVQIVLSNRKRFGPYPNYRPWTPTTSFSTSTSQHVLSSFLWVHISCRCLVVFYCALADFLSTGLIVYEHLATFSQEVTLVWRRKFTAATAIFLANRYLALFKSIAYAAGIGPMSDQRYCFTTNILSMVVEELSYAIWLSFSVLRVYALSGRDWRAALSVTVPGLVVLGANIYLYAKTISENFPYPIGCLWTPVMSPDLYNSLLIASRLCVIVTDVLVLVITWWRTYGTRKAAAEANIKVSLSTLILRDGTTYFLVLLAMNTLHIALTVSVRFTWIIALEEPLTTVLVSRFLLNLRAVDSNHSTDNITNPSFVQHRIRKTHLEEFSSMTRHDAA